MGDRSGRLENDNRERIMNENDSRIIGWCLANDAD